MQKVKIGTMIYQSRINKNITGRTNLRFEHG